MCPARLQSQLCIEGPAFQLLQAKKTLERAHTGSEPEASLAASEPAFGRRAHLPAPELQGREDQKFPKP